MMSVVSCFLSIGFIIYFWYLKEPSRLVSFEHPQHLCLRNKAGTDLLALVCDVKLCFVTCR